MSDDKYALTGWLTQQVANYVQCSATEIKIEVPLTEYGLDSVYALTLVGDIEEYLGVSIEPTIIWDYPTIQALTNFLIK